ncbi:MAG: PQQ-binding-like beta-propeller repeat protein [Acidobacteriota bacterium]
MATAVGLTALVAGATVGIGQSQVSRTTWTDYGGGPDSAKYSTLTQITKSNVGQLKAAWSYPTYDNTAYRFAPLVVGNVAYVLARDNSLVALDATTGKEIWIHAELQGMAPRGINYWQSGDGTDRRLIFQRNSYLEEIDAKTGKSILSFGNNGAVNLREGLGRDPATVTRVQSPNPGKVFENLIILGSAPGEAYLSAPGDLRAFDVVTGKLVWQFHTIPHPGEFGYETWPKDAWNYIGGTNTWGEISVDPVRGIAYFPVGSPTYDYYGADRHGANLFGTSLLALDARTGQRLWHFQMVHHDLWDYDNTAAPQLTTIRHNGQLVDVVAQAGKTGFLYVFNRVTGEPIWPIEERPVPKSDVPGEASWPTQPFPTNPPPFAKQSLNENEINPYILTPEERASWKDRIAKARKGGLFIPPAVGIETVAIPGAQGGANWGTTAADPTNGSVYVLSINVPSIYRLALEAPGAGRAVGAGAGRGASAATLMRGRAIYEERCQSCHGPNLAGIGNYPSLVDVTTRLSDDVLRTIITGGRLTMPPAPLPTMDMEALVAFLANPAAAAGRGFVGRGVGAPRTAPPGPVVARGGAPGAGAPPARGMGGGMAGPEYPAGVDAPKVRYYTDYGMQNTLVQPPYSTLTAFDLNTGTIKWQVPSGGDEPRAIAQGASDTGYPLARTGIITTATGLLFQAGLDRKLRAYDAETGRVLWAGDLPAGSVGVPAMYEVNGKQYLLVGATQGGGRGTGNVPATPGQAAVPADAVRAYVAFALP